MKDIKNTGTGTSKGTGTKTPNRGGKGFTLIEIIIAITISVIVMGGVFTFLTRLQADIIASRQKTAVYTNLSDFIGTMRNFTKLYESAGLVVDGTGYDVMLMLSRDKAAGVLIGVVEQGTGSTSRLDPIADKDIYGKKVIAYQKITTWQIDSILANTGSVYDIDFTDEGLFKDLSVTDFSVTPYNAGSLFEYKISVEIPYYEKLVGQPRSSIPQTMTTMSFTLDF